ncbi:hypothetical protein P3T76_010792 [Phytophthora citrophthora]|uniref:Uncharacterized protein n=1 Tax=Phytophthora citrophthora TaxID=4793 RepID=A0AAD9GAZ3_9STRA|nr:hypothetical protein P3T76_010792 [Phytophthora citrophthora]
MRECLMTLGLSRSQVLAWSSELQIKTTEKELEAAEETEEKFSREVKLINHQNCIISELVSMNKALTERVRLLETKQSTCQDVSQSPASSLEPAAEASAVGRSDSNNAKSCGTKALPKSPAAMWFEWYAKTPRMWDVCGDRQKKSAYKQTVNYMKLFLPEGFVLDPSAPGYCDEVLRYGTEAEAQLFKFFYGHGIKRMRVSTDSIAQQLYL